MTLVPRAIRGRSIFESIKSIFMFSPFSHAGLNFVRFLVVARDFEFWEDPIEINLN